MPKTKATAKHCPICHKPAVAAFAPFCSKRCADVDLNRWLSGSYLIPAAEDSPSAEEDETTTVH